MLKALARLFKTDKPAAPASAASSYWNTWQQTVDATQPQWVDWGEHPLFLGLIYRELFGAEETTLFHYLKARHPQFGNQQALSLCSGDGNFENLLVNNGVFGDITGIDISDYRVKKAQEQHGGANGKLHFTVSDVNGGDYGKHAYDVVFAKAALHHIENLDAAFAGMSTCLRPRGRLVTIDFFGPTRFQWTDAQLALANAWLQDIPEPLRTTRDGAVKTTIPRPTVAEMIAADPSEAVRSSEIRRFIDMHFHVTEEHDIGGTLFNLIFTADILNNFAPDDPEHRKIVETVFLRERELIKRGELPSDFKFIIAEKRG
jgi:ubiquinone/menaquinone biosynthesis C-methylase UbiE